MFGLLDKVLSRLPANGWKAILGGVSILVPQLNLLPYQEINHLLQLGGQVYLSLGLIHQAVKNVLKK